MNETFPTIYSCRVVLCCDFLWVLSSDADDEIHYCGMLTLWNRFFVLRQVNGDAALLVFVVFSHHLYFVVRCCGGGGLSAPVNEASTLTMPILSC